MTKPARFGITILTEPELLVEVMCERCGRDISNATETPITVVRIEGLAELIAMGQDGVVANLRSRIETQITEAREHGRTVIMDSMCEITRVGIDALRESLIRHAKMCRV